MSTTSVVMDLVKDRFAYGWCDANDGSVHIVAEGERFPQDENVQPCVVCPRCMEPAWAITRHAVERHGDSDVTVLPSMPGRTPPDWFRSDWV